MQTVTGVKKIEPNTLKNSNDNANYTFEVVIIEDNHLVNTLLTKA